MLRDNSRWWGRLMTMATNPRYANGNFRRKCRARFKAQGAPCAICGRPIDYEAPSDSAHPLSFVIDEIIPISRAAAYGYDSPAAAALDLSNLQPAHWVCNSKKSNKINLGGTTGQPTAPVITLPDGDW